MAKYVFAAFDVTEERFGFDGTMLTITEKLYWENNHAQQDFEIDDREVLSYLASLGFFAGDETTFEGNLSAVETQAELSTSEHFEFDQTFYNFLSQYIL